MMHRTGPAETVLRWARTSARRRPRLGRAAALALALVVAGCEQPGSDGDALPPLRFTAIPDQNSTELQEKFQPLVSHLTAALGVAVEYVPARDYQAAVEMFKNGDTPLAWFGGLTGVQARHAVSGARAIAQGDTDPHFYSYFIAHRDTGLTRTSDFPRAMEGRRFTFGSRSSTSGRLMPEFFIRERTDRSAETFFDELVGFSGSHDRTIALVASGQYDVGAVNYQVFDRYVAEGRVDPDVVHIIWQTPMYPDYNWTAHPMLDALFGGGFIDRLQQALVAIDDPAVLSALPRRRLVGASNEEFEAIRVVAETLDMLR